MAVFTRTTLLVVAVALLYPLVAYRARVLQLLVTNAPHKLVETNAFAHSSVHFAERLRNCEDGLMIEEERVAIFSCDPGRDAWNTVMGTFASDLSTVPHGQLYLYRYGQHEDLKEKALTTIELRGLPDAEAFHPLGIEYDKSSATLFVCNHSLNGSRIEVFSFMPNNDPSKMPVAIHQRTISIPTIKSPNSVLALNQNELYVSSDHYFLTKYHPILAWLETYLALPLAGVVYVNLLTDEVRTVAQVPFSNGISLINETTVAVASTSDASVRFFEMSADRSLRQTDKLNLPFMPDNLFTDTKGSLMITGHPHPPTLDKMRKERFNCLEETNIHNSECLHGVAPTSVVERLPDGTVCTLYTTKDQVVGGCTTLRDAEYNLGIVLGLYSKGILVWNM